MIVKSFILGRPGCGKTTVFHYVNNLMKNWGWKVTHISDYDILREIFNNDREGKRFRTIAHGGFDVLDFSVLDEALKNLEQRVKSYERYVEEMHLPGEKELILIEFARQNYSKELHLFSPEFKRNTHILFMDANIETCIERVRQRADESEVSDNHYTSEQIIRGYYGHDNRSFMLQQVEQNERERSKNHHVVWFMENNRSPSQLQQEVKSFIRTVLEQEELRQSEQKQLLRSIW